MRHEPDLIRKLLFYFEAMPDYKVEKCPSIDGYAEQDIMYHMLLLAQAELLEQIRADRNLIPIHRSGRM
jgi:hypothetical protein